MPDRRPLRADDVFALRFLAEVAVSPDGRHVACVERRVDERLDGVRSRILVVAVADGSAWSPSPVDATDSAPCWLADGSELAFRARRAEDGSGPRVADVDGGSGRPWPGVPPGASGFAVASDGAAIAVVIAADDAPPPDEPLWEVTGPGWHQDAAPTVERGTRSALWLVDRVGAARPLTAPTPGVHDRAPQWSPDGRWIVFLSDRSVEPDSPVEGPPPAHPLARPSRVWVLAGRGPEAAVPEPLLPPAAISTWTWSPDSSAIAWLGNPEPTAPGVAARLWVTSFAKGATRGVALPGIPAPGAAVRSDDPRGMGDATLAWTQDGRIWLRWAQGGASHLGWVDAARDAGPVTTVVAGDRAVLAFGVGPDGSVVAHVTATADHPGELAVCASDGSGERLLTDVNAALRGIELGRTRLVRATGPGDLPLEGWLVEPPASVVRPLGGVPVVVSVHGGPHHPVGWRFSLEHHRLAARGYAVVAGNARGSTGYGDAFATAIHGDWGGADLGDTHALLDAALATGGGSLDPARVALTGVSYGGFHTLSAITRSDRFRAAIAENGICDLVSAFGSAEDDGGFWIAEMNGAPWELPGEYADRSPLTHADRIRTPLLLLHAEEDHDCPVAQSEELYSALVRLGRPVRFLRARGVGHLMNFTGGGRFRLARAAAIDDWLDRWLRATPDTTHRGDAP